MITLMLSQLVDVLDAQLIGDDTAIQSVSTDTRTIESGSLFVALVGERFDAHDFAGQAVTSGASALLVSKAVDVQVPQLLVENTKVALGKLGQFVHQVCQTPTVAITGSCGKTTVKEMVASIMSQQGQVLYTAGNFNNDIGVPLTLLRSQPEDDFAVIELGANHIGEIAYTTQLVSPDVALVNNVAAAHLEGFGSMDGVKRAKGEIYQGLKPGSVAIVNLDSHGGDYWREVLSDKTVKTFSLCDNSAEYKARNVTMNVNGEASFTVEAPDTSFDVKLGMIGQHNVANALAAVALSIELGATSEMISSGLANLSKVKGRVETIELSDSIRLIDDSYNASVPAMKAAADLLNSFDGIRWLILGNMAELGDESLALHRQVGEHAAPFKFEYVLTYGADTQAISDVCKGKHFDTHDSMIEFIEQQLNLNTGSQTLLVKGANSAGMIKIAAALKEMYT
ncbi:UDP-N-acetylmuramoyl-tripeptide--D-alanyl-D-alanine ligase [Vibrio neptunius]|uniref:UDP-N-acetylmuramoyl-tripeptide--D-alanyl-D-alanine ligase n=1 Tax=Vibrio neptunius TaxID=170651 RepID=A0ABS2ZZA9_9VIBR|nr:UDP-N-acetylmuramoyl-tripeptide--D-alanyl-D-alanine ligase [Vibrio neptunius]MBN3491419.1 UDP-N-acetylmuramoyl-tripeptide--D-alanyl-D-alanine ligase [Vibrio neptunius]MBN3513839.1 UDP-N-acetylmuramoyl-tripeptide--D-alanyl-D-alanine ligase [Vibrio neptunius]MBN3548180.1 UDP-N-acetylmuramoyl-tripeptide--D-alanyl-D-alanine ligase [Vibrio neptunius]MBN3576233.1 UDP-N-acetylmuramoyl-tripeptide--D-alanyl-D-alanine ligase [Vibrio neptunius]MCH9869897.1 UDP-N-acetylmuramoyl-tripeptide--D-alanyl-D-a